MSRQPDNSSNHPQHDRCPAVLLLLLFHVASGNSFADEARDKAIPAAQHFSESVLPLLKKHCYECHSHEGDAVEGGLVLDSRAGWRMGGDSGPAIVPGSLDKSLLLNAIGYSNSELQMPPDGKLPQRDIDVLRRWVADGAYDPRVGEDKPLGTVGKPNVEQAQLWSLQPIERVEVPDAGDGPWIRNDIDRFILARLGQHDLTPNTAADRYTLLRRATFDLTGLPPTLDEIDAFVDDNRANSYERMIERLLESPYYGQRWGRHWLDLARYGDSNGGDINYAHANAWRYRDYVIQSFNEDKPYNDFVREQLAGDLLPDDGNAERRRERLTATGFLMLGPKMLAEVDTDKLLMDIVDEQLDVTGLTFLGMTFGCARCHDHKFDPITTADYYAMAGIFRSTKVIDVLRPSNGVSEWLEIDVTPPETLAIIEKRTAELKRLQQLLVDLGATAPASGAAANAAGKAVRAAGLPAIRSTTWSAWVRIAAGQNLGAVVSADFEGADQGHSLGFDRGSTPRIVWNHGSQPHTIIAASKPVSLNRWHHLALTLDAASQQLRLFVNGDLAVLASDVATSEYSTLAVGRREASRQWQLIGAVDDVQVYDTALTKAQVQELAAKRRPAVTPLLHWSFDRVREATVIDTGPNGFDGRLIGVSAKTGIIKNGLVGQAMSFSNSAAEAKADPQSQAKIAELKRQVQQIQASLPKAASVMAVAEAKPLDLPVHIRGNHRKLAEMPIARGTPAVFAHALEAVQVPPHENGRLQLANWIASPKNPLTARVIVNRIWQHHFQNGLVRTASNFGTRGEQPSHPELLDWLAHEFVASGWSIKQMHRLIMNSASYRMSSRFHEDASQRDPDNRLLGRYPIRRLEAEEIRDSLLAVSGDLDKTVGGTMFESPNKQRVTMSPMDAVYSSPRRSVYLPSIRVRSYELFSIFDVSDNGQHVALRPQTMVAQQALFLMNNPFVIQRAESLARQVSQQAMPFDQRVDWLHRLLYGRPAGDGETATLDAAFAELAARDVSGPHSSTESDIDVKTFAWRHIIHTMLCANEFIHVR